MPDTSETFKQPDSTSYDLVAERACIHAGSHVLDLGCGSGILTLAAAKKLSRGGTAIGIDISGGMLDQARGRAAEQGLRERAELFAMDAEAFSFPDRTFDAVVSLFAFPHFPDPARALREVVRVMRPQGRVAVGIGAEPQLSWAGGRHAFTRTADLIGETRGRFLTATSYLDHIVAKHLTALFRSTGLQVTAQCWKTHTHTLQRRGGLIYRNAAPMVCGMRN